MSCSKPLFWVETHENVRRMWSCKPCRWTSFTLDRFAAEGCSYFYNSANLAWNYLEPWPFRSSSHFYLMFQTEKSGILGIYFSDASLVSKSYCSIVNMFQASQDDIHCYLKWLPHLVTCCFFSTFSSHGPSLLACVFARAGPLKCSVDQQLATQCSRGYLIYTLYI